MQFQYNDDYPDRFYMNTNDRITTTTSILNTTSSSTSTTTISNTTAATTIPNINNNNNLHNLDARNPIDFPKVQPISCTRITTRIYNPMTQTILTVPNVLIKTPTRSIVSSSSRQQQRRNRNRNNNNNNTNSNNNFMIMNIDNLDELNNDDNDARMQDEDNDDDDDSSSNSDFSSSIDNDDNDNMNDPLSESNTNNNNNHIAYWIQNTIREAIYGRVYKAIVLHKIQSHHKQQITSLLQLQQQQQQQQQNSTTTTTTTTNNIMNIEWEITNYDCAIKEMSWQHIYKQHNLLAEDPIKEVNAMQYFKNWFLMNTNNHNINSNNSNQIQQQEQPQSSTILSSTYSNNVISSTNINTNNNISTETTTIPSTTTTTTSTTNNIQSSFQQMVDTNVMMPLDLLTDEKHLYSIMPYCNGGELFELLNINDRFHENEARYFMKQILNGIDCLQHAGICHRDMSLENLLVHNNGILIIDMGMCLRIPYKLPETNNNNNNNDITKTTATTPRPIISSTTTTIQATDMMLIDAQNNITTTVTASTTTINSSNTTILYDIPSVKGLHRYMIKPQGICGKWHYMSPEIHNNTQPFDGYAVDMWAVGVILFLMLTGFPPWDRPSMTDERFKYMSAGYLVQMLTEWDIGLSPDAMDLLQRMMFLDPKDRLSLQQVRAHPWMVNGPCEPPISLLSSIS